MKDRIITNGAFCFFIHPLKKTLSMKLMSTHKLYQQITTHQLIKTYSTIHITKLHKSGRLLPILGEPLCRNWRLLIIYYGSIVPLIFCTYFISYESIYRAEKKYPDGEGSSHQKYTSDLTLYHSELTCLLNFILLRGWGKSAAKR